jgi:radical SAM superfamily enzyme YgiQ (UPF0313 family)
MPPRVCLFSLPPYPAISPYPALCYLKGHVEKQSPQTHVEVYHWNQTIPRTCVGVSPGAFGEAGYATFFLALFHGCYQKFNDKVDVSHPLYGAGASWMIDRSTESFLQVVDSVCGYIDSEIEAHRLDQCDICGCSINFNQLISSVTILSRIKAINPGALAVVGGLVKSEASLLLEAFPSLDLCVIGDGEQPFYDVCKQHPSRDYLSVSGVTFRHEGTIRTNEAVPFSGETAWADYSGFNWADNSLGSGPVVVPICDSRGCVWGRCKWCNFNMVSPSFIERTPENIAAEAKHHLETLGTGLEKEVCLNFLGNSVRGSSNERFAALLRQVIALRDELCPRLTVHCELSPMHIDEQIGRLLNALSAQVQFGFEHWSDAMLKLHNKPHRMIHTVRALKLLDRNPRIRLIGVNTLLGYPGETLREIGDAMRNLYVLRLIWSSLSKNGQTDLRLIAEETSGISVNPASPLGSTWDFENPIIVEQIRNSALARALTSMVADVELCRKIAVFDGLYAIPDLTATFAPGQWAFREVLSAIRLMETACFVSPEGFPTLRTKFAGEDTELLFDDEVHRMVLELTDGPVALKDVALSLPGHSEEEVQQCISDLSSVGLLYVDARHVINTLPWQFQQMLHTASERRA